MLVSELEKKADVSRRPIKMSQSMESGMLSNEVFSVV